MQPRECAVSSFRLVGRPKLRLFVSPGVRRSLRDNNAIINHIGRAFTFCSPFLPVYSHFLSPPRASSLLMRNCGRSVHFKAPVSFLAGSVYHAVCSRRLDKDYTSYTPYGRYIGMRVCVSVAYVDVNTWVYFGGVSSLRCVLSGTIRSTVRCHRSVWGVHVEQWVISLQATGSISFKTRTLIKGVVQPNYKSRHGGIWLCR